MLSLATFPAVRPAVHPHVMTIEDRVGACLKPFGDAVIAVSPGRWRINQAGERQTGTMVTVDEDWLVVEKTLSGCRFARVRDVQKWSWRLLDATLDLPSRARPVLSAQDNPARVRADDDLVRELTDNNLVRIRAERSLQRRPAACSDDELRRWIVSACEDVAVASVGAPLPAKSNTPPAVVVDASRAETAYNQATHPDIPALCELAGWPASTRGASKETLVPLPARGDDVCHALATVSGATIRFQTALTLSPTNETTPACLAAAAVALLRVAGSVRLVRATLTHVDGSVAAALDVRAQLPLGPDNVNHALSSLSVARQQVAAELGMLAGDDALASAYLAIQGLR